MHISSAFLLLQQGCALRLFRQYFAQQIIDLLAPRREFAIHTFAAVVLRTCDAIAVYLAAEIGTGAFLIDFSHSELPFRDHNVMNRRSARSRNLV
jgi:hypothetical protein